MKLARATLAAVAVVLTGPVAGAQEIAARLFLGADRDRDGVLTRAELEATLGAWEALTPEQLPEGLERALPLPPQNQTPKPADVQAMLAALPDKAAVDPAKPRRVLVLGKALGYVHSSIPLAARTIEEMGRQTGAWSTTVTYDPADRSSTIPRTLRSRRRAARRCSTSCAAARAWPASTPPALATIRVSPRPALPRLRPDPRPPWPRPSSSRAIGMETAGSAARSCAPSRMRGTTASIRNDRGASTRPPFRSASRPSCRRRLRARRHLAGRTGSRSRRPRPSSVRTGS